MIKNNLVVIAILIFASILRFVFLGTIPSPLHYTEATLGLRAQNLLSFGKDEFGRNLPFIFSNWRDFEMPLPTYLSLPFINFSGTNPFFLRLPFAIAGVLSVLGGILLAQKIWPEKRSLALWVGFFLAINPWGFWLSRIVSSELLAFTLVLFGFYLFYTRRYWGIIILILAGLSSKTATIFLLLFTIIYILFLKKDKILAIVSLVMVILIVSIISIEGGLKSFYDNQFGIFSVSEIYDHINLLRGNDITHNIPSILSMLFYNKLFILVKIFENFLSFFNPSYYFARGDSNSFNQPGNFGPLLIIFLPFFVFGLFKLVQEKSPKMGFLMIWILSSILAQLFLANTPKTDSFIFCFFPIAAISAWGLLGVPKRYLFILGLIIFLNLAIVSFDVLNKEPQRSESTWNPGTVGLANYLKNVSKERLKFSYKHELITRIWVSDGLDPNPGPVIAYFLNTPYYDLNTNNSKNIYRGWISRVGQIFIGNQSLIKDHPEEFDLVIIPEKQKELYKCSNLRDILGEGNYKYLVIERCYEKKES